MIDLRLQQLCERLGRVRSRLDTPKPNANMAPGDQVLAAAMTRLISEPFEVISKGLNPARFERWVPGLRRKAVREFSNSDALTMRVLQDAIALDRSELTNQLLAGVAESLHAPDVDHEEVVRELGTTFFNSVCDDPALSLQMYAWLSSKNVAVLRSGMRALYESLDDRVSSGLDGFLAHWRRDLSDEIDSREVAALLTAVVEGLAIRCAVNPDGVSPDLAARGILALIRGVTSPLHSPIL